MCVYVCVCASAHKCVCMRVCVYIRACILAKTGLYSEMELRRGGRGHAASVMLRGSIKAQALRMGGGQENCDFGVT